MSEFARFMRGSKAVKHNEKHAATRSLTDENGTPLLWEFRHLTSKEVEELREECTDDVPVVGKPHLTRPRFNSAQYARRLIAASVVVPDLYDAELQDSYGVKTPEELLLAMVDDPGEYNDLAAYIQQLHGFDTSFEDKVQQAKN